MPESLPDYYETDWSDWRKKAVKVGALMLATTVAINGVAHVSMQSLAGEPEPDHIELVIEDSSAQAPEDFARPAIVGTPETTQKASTTGRTFVSQDGSRVVLL